MSQTRPATTTGPTPLPTRRGEVSAALADALVREPGEMALPTGRPLREADPYGDDLQLALYMCYELHYQGFSGVDDAWEWDPELLRTRQALERRFLEALRPDATTHDDPDAAVAGLLVEPAGGTGVSHHLRDDGELWQMREYIAQRSLYQLKEADPHVWAVPRLRGQAKAAMAAVEYDEFGAGRGERVHAELFADLMADLALDPTYNHYLDAASARMLAVVNMMSLLGLHRSLRGALVGHFATVEITSSPASDRLAQALRRMGAGEAAVFFYTEHVEADAVHEQIVRHEVIGDLLRSEPALAADVAFGVDATVFLEDRFAEEVLGAWREGRSSLRVPL
ncbi:iron-containing redox enzyme family protein [Streptomyces sp. S465]|uniref:iron-containing redox enzyme family protein n=1 Tax=Streptomyces sp. S465 TaxID=2979468 RepID=UPI0022A849AA|nr:iron-containing redox enzyme family protein [Streptomyces sp. S465]WAP60074.1 iron-containing redox enzyme family protein [Streptomyces sp. S465]